MTHVVKAAYDRLLHSTLNFRHWKAVDAIDQGIVEILFLNNYTAYIRYQQRIFR